MTDIKKSTRSQRWPMDIPVAIRKELDCDTQVCAFQRLLLSPENEAFDGQRVRLDWHLMALVTRGNLLIERPEGSRWVKEGNAVLVLPGQIRLTEFPEEAGGSVDISYFLFSTRFIRNRFLNNPTVDFFANQVYPAFKDIYVLEYFVPRVRPMVRANPPERGFATMIDYIVNGMFAVGFMFLKDAFFAKKRALDILLEHHIADPMAENTAASAYHGGARALRRDCKIYMGMSPEQWLLKRRMQLARIWIRHSERPADEIAGTLGYQTRSSFRDDYWEAHRRDYASEERLYNLKSMATADYVNLVTPFWRMTEEKLSGTQGMPDMKAHRRLAHPDSVRLRRKKTSAPAANDSTNATAAPSGGVANSDEIEEPDNPGLIVMDAPEVDARNLSSRESFACLKSTGAEVIFFPKNVTKCTDEEMERHMRTTRMWDLAAA